MSNQTLLSGPLLMLLGLSWLQPNRSRIANADKGRVEALRLTLVVDEAHFAFQRVKQMTVAPEIIDWIDTALVNQGVGVALVTTPQFLERIAQASVQVGWNDGQFKRRVSKWERLPKRIQR